jgi:hypothetical protein
LTQRGALFPPRLREVVGLLVDRTGHLRGAAESLQQRIHAALGVRHAPPLPDPLPDLGRRPEPPSRHRLGQLRLLLGRQERRRSPALGVPPLQGRQPTGPVPCQPALDRPLVHPEHLGNFARRLPDPHQPQPMQPGTHIRPTLPTIPRVQARRVVLRCPRHRQFPSPPHHLVLVPSYCSNYTARSREFGMRLSSTTSMNRLSGERVRS